MLNELYRLFLFIFVLQTYNYFSYDVRKKLIHT
jgi:hypothetical protein